MISLPHRTVFIHIPKTGGSSIAKYLGCGVEGFIGHQTYLEHRAFAPHLCEAFDILSVVRNPYARAVSCYLSFSGDPTPSAANCEKWLLDGLCYSFYPILRSQYAHLTDGSGPPPTLTILRFETLADDFARHFGEPLPYHLNRQRGARDENAYLAEGARELIRTFWADDFGALGYEI